MYPASEWRIAPRALDDDSRASVLINRSGTRDAFSRPGFPTRRWTVLRLLLSSADLWWYVLQRSRRGGGKVESVLCFPSAAPFPRPSSCRRPQALMLIVPTAR